MDDSTLAQLEDVATIAFSKKNPAAAPQASLKLNAFAHSGDLLQKSKFIMSKSNNPYCLFYAFTVLRDSFTTNWNSLTSNERNEMSMHFYCTFLFYFDFKLITYFLH